MNKAQRILILILVDQRYLRVVNNRSKQIKTSDICLSHEDNLAALVEDPGGYLGHYILIHQYDKKTDLFHYKDPNVSQTTCSISGSKLEMARKAFGTDEDIIIIDFI